MAKTLVRALHPGGPKANGIDGCHTRWKDGFCAGNQTADWLNGMGDDDEPYGHGIKAADGHVITNGEVRRNWLRDGSSTHIQKVR